MSPMPGGEVLTFLPDFSLPPPLQPMGGYGIMCRAMGEKIEKGKRNEGCSMVVSDDFRARLLSVLYPRKSP